MTVLRRLSVVVIEQKYVKYVFGFRLEKCEKSTFILRKDRKPIKEVTVFLLTDSINNYYVEYKTSKGNSVTKLIRDSNKMKERVQEKAYAIFKI